MDAIFERRSVRKFKDQPVEEDKIKTLLRAAMAAPSAGNQQAWEFIVLRDKEAMKKIMEINPYAGGLKEAPVAIVVCGNEDAERAKGFWVQDCSAATQNILLEAHQLGLGAVWIGTYPIDERVESAQTLLRLPRAVKPLSIIALGYPSEVKPPEDRYDESKVHYDKW